MFGGLRLQTPGQKLTPAGPGRRSRCCSGCSCCSRRSPTGWTATACSTPTAVTSFTGASYTDVNALLVPKTILVVRRGVCALAFFANILFRNFLLPAAALVLLAAVQPGDRRGLPGDRAAVRGEAQPDQKEAPYIKRAIDSTLAATTSRNVDYDDYDAGQTANTAGHQAERWTLRNDTRRSPTPGCWTRTCSSATFDAQQQIQNVYGFPKKLDIDRYTIGGKAQDYVVAARELDTRRPVGQPGQLDQPAHRLHARQRLRRRAGQRGRSPTRRAASELHHRQSADQRANIPVKPAADLLRRARSTTTRSSGAARAATPREFDEPANNAQPTGQQHLRRQGRRRDRRLLPAADVRDQIPERNFLLSGAVNNDSKMLYVRDPRERVEKTAPFLKVDGDPYPAVINGRVTWILDGYTTQRLLPLRRAEQLGRRRQGLADRRGDDGACPTQEFNYIRNSVKATVDAYDGTVTLYAWDDQGPGAARPTRRPSPAWSKPPQRDEPANCGQPRPLPGGPVQDPARHPDSTTTSRTRGVVLRAEDAGRCRSDPTPDTAEPRSRRTTCWPSGRERRRRASSSPAR